jgi:integrase
VGEGIIPSVAKRSYGTGSLLVRSDANGREAWYGQWRHGGRLVKRKLGPKRRASTSEGMTKAQAEARLRELIAEVAAAPDVERVDVADAGRRWLEHLTAMGRKRSTLMDYESALRVHVAPFFAGRMVADVTCADIERFMAAKAAAGLSPKSVRNFLGIVHSIFSYAERRGWCKDNPCRRVEFPRIPERDADIRFLDTTEVEALLRAVDLESELGRTDHTLYLTAAMTGLRQGELLALRWRDIDWLAGRVRVRRNLVRGEFGTPKSRRSSRSVPLADRVLAELDGVHKRSRYRDADDLVFCHPLLGKPLERSRLLKRFKANAAAAGLRELRFHDLRHTFGTRMAAAGVPMRTLQEWLGHRDFKTTLIYADYAPNQHERELVTRAFAPADPLLIAGSLARSAA